MKLLNYIYFNIFRWYYKDGNHNRKVDPTGMVAFMFATCVAGWGMIGTAIYCEIKNINIKQIELVVIVITIIVALAFGALINEFYLSKNRYLNLYTEYISKNKVRNKNKGILISFLFLLFPYLLFAIYGIIKTLN